MQVESEYLSIQCKLTVGAPNDPLENEADAMADSIMRQTESDVVQRKCADCEKDDQQLHRKAVRSLIQKKLIGKEQPSSVSLSQNGFIPSLQRMCTDCENEIQRKPLTAFAQRKSDDEKNQTNHSDQRQSFESTNTIQKKCAACEDEKINRKPLSSFIQRKNATDTSVASDGVASRIEAGKDGGNSLSTSSRNFMEDRFGSDFSNVRVHTGGDAAQLSSELSAQAFTVGNDIFFNEGKYNPETNDGKHLLAHELTHVIQQNGSDTIQRKPGDVSIIPKDTTDDVDFNINSIFNAFDAIQIPYDLQQVLVVAGKNATLYDVQRKDKAITKKPIGSYAIKQMDLPPSSFILLPNGKFGIIGEQEIELANNQYKDEAALIGTTTAHNAEEKKLIDAANKQLTVSDWFLNEDRKADFYKKLKPLGFAISVLPARKGSKGASGGDAAAAKPPMPKWMKDYREQMKTLIGTLRLFDKISTDLPNEFFVYYSSISAKWRGGASQITNDPKNPLKVYLDIDEKDDKKEKLQQIRDLIRIKQLHKPEPVNEDSKQIDIKLSWAYRIKEELDALIRDTRKNSPQEIDLPDRTAVTFKDDDPVTPYLKLSLYVTAKIDEGQPISILKEGVMPNPLTQDTEVDSLFNAVKEAVMALRGDKIKPFDDNRDHYKKTLEAFPSTIESLNIRDDYRSVTGAELEMYMNVNFAGLPGMDTANQVVQIINGMVYAWDVYRISDVIPNEELNTFPKDWKDRRVKLQNWFKSSGQLTKANPVLNEEIAGVLNGRTPSAEDIKTLRKFGLVYGVVPSNDATTVVNMPMKEGEYVIYCRAQAIPGNDTYRMPSESFFTVQLADGYKLAEEVRDERLHEMEKLEQQIPGEKDDRQKQKLQQKLDELKSRETRTLSQATEHNISEQEEIIDLATMLIDFYQRANSNASVTDLIVEEAKKGKLSDKAFDKILDVWMYIETSAGKETAVEKLVTLVKDTKKNLQQFQDLQGRIGKFSKDLIGYDIQPVPVVGLVSRVTGQVYPLLLTLGIGVDGLGRTHAMLVDVTTGETQASYEGMSYLRIKHGGYDEAVKSAFEQFGRECKYGEGYIAYRIPGTQTMDKVPSKPGTWQEIKRILSVVAAVAGIAALIVGSVVTAGAVAVIAGYVGVGAMVVGAGLALDNIIDRASNHRIHADPELAMDILAIAGPLLNGAGTLGRYAQLKSLKSIVDVAEITGEAATGERGILTGEMISRLGTISKINKAIMIVQKGEAIANLGLIAYKTYLDLAMVSEVYADDPKKLAAMQAEIMKNALISGAFAIIALHSEFKIRNSDELESLVSNLTTENNYQKAMIKSGIKDSDGNWRDPKLKEYFLGKFKKEEAHVNEAEKIPPHGAGTKEHHVPDEYENNREVEMKGHEESPDHLHEVEAYPDGSVGRCSSTPGARCPALQLEFRETLAERPVIKKELEDLLADIGKYNDKVPKQKMKALGLIEQRLRNLQTVSKNSSAPKGYKIVEVEYGHDDVTPLAGKNIVEFPGGERVWRDADGMHHEAVIGTSIGRKGKERGYFSGSEMGIDRLAGTERSHTFGQGFGWESPFALYYAPPAVNQRLQNNGIEQFVRTARDLMPPGEVIVLKITTKPEPRTRALKTVSYEGFIQTAGGEKIPAFDYDIDLTWNADNTKLVSAKPIRFRSGADAASQKTISDFRARMASKMPEPITKTFHEVVK